MNFSYWIIELLKFQIHTLIVPYLNEYVGLGQIERGVSDFWDEDGADFRVVLEVLDDTDSLRLGGGTVDERPLELLGIVLQGKDIVAVG